MERLPHDRAISDVAANLARLLRIPAQVELDKTLPSEEGDPLAIRVGLGVRGNDIPDDCWPEPTDLDEANLLRTLAASRRVRARQAD